MQNNVAPVIKYGIAAIFAIIGVSGSFKLIVYGSSSSSSVAALVSVSLFGLLLIFFGDQVDWFDLKNLKVKMRKIEEARAEIQKREKRVTDIARILSEERLRSTLSALHRSYSFKQFHVFAIYHGHDMRVTVGIQPFLKFTNQ